MTTNLKEQVTEWAWRGADGPGPKVQFYNDGTLVLLLADGKGTVTLDPQGNITAAPVDGAITGFGGGSPSEISGAGGAVDAAATTGPTVTAIGGKGFHVIDTHVSGVPNTEDEGNLFSVTTLNNGVDPFEYLRVDNYNSALRVHCSQWIDAGYTLFWRDPASANAVCGYIGASTAKDLTIAPGSGGLLLLSGLPTSNPGAGILWNNGGTPAIGT